MVTNEEYWHGTTKFGDKDESNDWGIGKYEYDVPPPPPPPKELHDKYGIEYCHSTIEAALEAANDGDKIYLEEGHFNFDTDSLLYIDKNVEIIGLGENPEDTLVDRGHRFGCLHILAKKVLLANFTIRCSDDPQNRPPDPSAYCDPLVIVERRNVGLVYLDRVVFEMGSEQKAIEERKRFKNYVGTSIASFHKNIISGIQIQSGENIVLYKCRFNGGHGAAISVMHEPLFHDKVSIDGELFCAPPRNIEIVCCTINQSGQTWSNGALLRSKGHHYNNTVIPKPGAIELWSIRRKDNDLCYGVELKGKGATHTIRLAGNHISDNFRAPITYRVLENRSCDKDKKTQIGIMEAEAKDSTEDCRHLTVGPYDLSFSTHNANTISNNGILVEECVAFPVANVAAKEEKVETPFPDGETVLAIDSDAYETMFWSNEQYCIYHKLGDMWNEVGEIEKYWWY